jgi:hypothetical protein
MNDRDACRGVYWLKVSGPKDAIPFAGVRLARDYYVIADSPDDAVALLKVVKPEALVGVDTTTASRLGPLAAYRP